MEPIDFSIKERSKDWAAAIDYLTNLYVNGTDEQQIDAVKILKANCKHENTINAGDEENLVVYCTDCLKVLKNNTVKEPTEQDYKDDADYVNAL